MNLQIIQFSIRSLYSVYIVRELLPDNELASLDKLLRSLTEKDSMGRKTNVKGNMTDYIALQNIPECNNLFKKTILTIDSVVKLRSCHSLDTYNYYIKDAWGMRHNTNDYSIKHAHYPSHWSAAFYTSVHNPRPKMDFDEFEQNVELEPNMLVFFPGMVNHSVSSNQSEKERISMAFNIDVEKR